VACQSSLPVDVAVFAAAVADWRVYNEDSKKIKKQAGALPDLCLTENPDILATISKLQDERPELVIGFAAETENIIGNGKAKLTKKGCDWIVANDVSSSKGTFGGEDNQVFLLKEDSVEDWPKQSKQDVAQALGLRISDHFQSKST
jgi:phosphopantothenoylcysteine decarboxylase/phosphopantothenate--cysteine ligase